MPRKQTTILDNLNIPVKAKARSRIQEVMRDRLMEIPPDFFGLISHTPDQKRELRKYREMFRRVGAIIDSYWEGTKPPDYSAMSKWECEQLWLEAFYFLAFYKMVWANWKSVEKGYKQIKGLPDGLPDLRIQWVDAGSFTDDDFEEYARTGSIVSDLPALKEEGVYHIPLDQISAPLEAATEFMQYRAIGYIERAFKDKFKETANFVRGKMAEEKKLTDARTKPAKKQQIRNDIVDKLPEHPYQAFELTTYAIVKNSKPKHAKKKAMKEYAGAKADMYGFLGKINHERVGRECSVWENGVRISGP